MSAAVKDATRKAAEYSRKSTGHLPKNLLDVDV